MSGRDPNNPTRFCPNCGSVAPVSAKRCPRCAEELEPPIESSRLWGQHPESPPAKGEIIDLYPSYDMSSQATTPFTQTRPFDPDEYKKATAQPPRTTVPPPGYPSDNPRPAWNATKTVPAPVLAAKPKRERTGPPGCVLGALAILLIAAVGMIAAGGSAGDLVQHQVQSRIIDGIVSEMRTIDAIKVPASGQFVLTDAEINADLDQYSGAYFPFSDAVASVTTEAVTVKLELTGTTTTVHTRLDVENGRIVLVDPVIDGAAGQLLDADEIARAFESQLASLMQRSDLRPTGIRLRDGAIAIQTEPALT